MTDVMKFDPNKPYGTITGANDGRVYEQNGVVYRADGTPWEEAKEPPPKKTAAPKPVVALE